MTGFLASRLIISLKSLRGMPTETMIVIIGEWTEIIKRSLMIILRNGMRRIRTKQKHNHEQIISEWDGTHKDIHRLAEKYHTCETAIRYIVNEKGYRNRHNKYGLEYYYKNHAKRLLEMKVYYAITIERQRQRSRIYYWLHREDYARRNKAWQKNNPEKVRARARAYYLRKLARIC